MSSRTLIGLAATALLGAAPPAHAAIDAADPVSPEGLSVQQAASAAAGNRGAVLMVGHRGSASRPGAFALYARLGRGTHLGPSQRLDTHSAFAPQVAVGSDGTVVAAWTGESRGSDGAVRFAIAEPGKPFGRAQTLSGSGRAALGDVAVSATGRALIVTRTRTADPTVGVFIRAPRHRFGAPQSLGTSRYYLPAAAAAPDGTFVVSWLDTPAPPAPPPAPYTPTPAVVRAATLGTAASRFGPATALGELGFWFSGPEAASGPGGAAIAWRQTYAEKRLVAVERAGVLGGPVPLPIPMPPSGEGQPDELALGLPATGPTVALWHEVGGVSGDVFRVTSSVVKASVRSADGTFPPADTISTPGALAGQPQAAALTDRVLAAWSESVRGRTARVCVTVDAGRGARSGSRCLRAPAVDPNTVDVAAGRSFGLVSWIERGADPVGGGRLYLATYRR